MNPEQDQASAGRQYVLDAALDVAGPHLDSDGVELLKLADRVTRPGSRPFP
jgi:hypothetical protein